MQGVLIKLALVIAVGVAIIGLSEWRGWGSEARTASAEAEWIDAYGRWFDGIDQMLIEGRPISGDECRTRFRRLVGDAPSERLEPVAEAGVGGCAALRSRTPDDAWLAAFDTVAMRLTAAHAQAPDRPSNPISPEPR